MKSVLAQDKRLAHPSVLKFISLRKLGCSQQFRAQLLYTLLQLFGKVTETGAWRNQTQKSIQIILTISIIFMLNSQSLTSQSCSQQSLDSSNIPSIASSFESTQSFTDLHDIPAPNSNICEQQKQNNESVLQSAKQNTRFQSPHRHSDYFTSIQPQPFIGFVIGGAKGNKVNINQSKLKKARLLMDLDQQPTGIDFNYNYNSKIENSQDKNQNDNWSESTQSIGDKQSHKLVQQQHKNQSMLFPDFSLGFKSLGTGAMIQISEQASNKAKLFFSQFDMSQKSSNIKTKQTKSKFPKSEPTFQSVRASNYTKTEKVKPIPAAKNMKKPASINVGKQIIDEILIKNQKRAKSQIVKLQNLSQVSIVKARQFAEHWKTQSSIYLPVQHDKSQCMVNWCYFCQKYEHKIEISESFLIDELCSMTKLQQTTKSQAPKMLKLILLKLAKYTYFQPLLRNKQVQVSTIFLQLYKKCMSMQKSAFVSPLSVALYAVISSKGSKVLGRQIVLVIIDVSHSEQMDAFFIQLSDGWTSAYAVINKHNQLHSYAQNKMIIGSKIEIVNWNIHPVCNILSFHPNKESSNSNLPCIQINYNNSLPANYWSKLGYPKQLFFRSVQKCKQNDVAIPLVQGSIIRMFSVRNQSQKHSQPINYIQVLLSQGSCVLMRVMLSDQVSLVELFRLYYSYHFLRVKKISSSMLEFGTASKYYEIEDSTRMQRIKELFKSRLLSLSSIKILNDPTDQSKDKQQSTSMGTMSKAINIKRCYIDMVTKSGQLMLGNTKINIQQKIEGNTVLLQQYTISATNQGIMISKGDRGSCLRRIPKIYDTIQYHIF